jgi:hypothetical protein
MSGGWPGAMTGDQGTGSGGVGHDRESVRLAVALLDAMPDAVKDHHPPP